MNRKKILSFFNTMIGCCTGTFIGLSFMDYMQRDLYSLSDTPWNIRVLYRAGWLAVSAAVILVLKFIVKRRMDK